MGVKDFCMAGHQIVAVGAGPTTCTAEITSVIQGDKFLKQEGLE